MNEDIGEQKTGWEADRSRLLQAKSADSRSPIAPQDRRGQLRRKCGRRATSWGRIGPSRSFTAAPLTTTPLRPRVQGRAKFRPHLPLASRLGERAPRRRNDQAGYFYYVMELADDATVGQVLACLLRLLLNLRLAPSSMPKTRRGEDRKTGLLPQSPIANRKSERLHPQDAGQRIARTGPLAGGRMLGVERAAFVGAKPFAQKTGWFIEISSPPTSSS